MSTKVKAVPKVNVVKTKLSSPKRKFAKLDANETAPAVLNSQTDSYKTFKVSHGSQTKLTFHSNDLINFMREHTEIDAFYSPVPTIDASVLVGEFSNIKQMYSYSNGRILKELVGFLEKYNHENIDRLSNMVDNGKITWDLCAQLFPAGSEIEIQSDCSFGARVHALKMRQTWFGPVIDVVYDYISSNGTELTMNRGNTVIPYWSGVRDICELHVRQLSAERKAELLERGKRYKQYAIGANYLNFTGHIEVKRWWKWEKMRADGRIMVDRATYEQFNDSDLPRGDAVAGVDDSKLWMADPYVYGFSFATKSWGRMLTDNIASVTFNCHAFDQLVLDSDKKNLIKALVVNSASGFTDIIGGKGGGCIFLLHGEPGVGKTLTAEAIAELLQRPLYSVSVGELGVTPTELETKLRNILDVAQIWNAVILIDEADIFLEKRGGDITRSAMTSVFLRLAEYHKGVLFLTTNRVKTFDPAFYSRVSIALKYDALSQEARCSIWNNLLMAAGIKNMDVDALSKIEVNGRQIKNTIRLAQGLAKQEGVAINQQHVMQVVDIAKKFLTDIAADEAG